MEMRYPIRGTYTYDLGVRFPTVEQFPGAIDGVLYTGFCYESRLFDRLTFIDGPGYFPNMTYDTPARYQVSQQVPEVDEPLIIEVPKEKD
ncbi:MAG: hypothetical protein HYS12_18400 [Planctomycetes bacterium]|nr:hypothetical protein [Planctomycetota bacterium]